MRLIQGGEGDRAWRQSFGLDVSGGRWAIYCLGRRNALIPSSFQIFFKGIETESVESLVADGAECHADSGESADAVFDRGFV